VTVVVAGAGLVASANASSAAQEPAATTSIVEDYVHPYQIPANGYVAISPGTGEEVPRAVLVELRLT
jgi:hypothetical protein